MVTIPASARAAGPPATTGAAARTGGVAGTVVDARARQPLAGVCVSVRQRPGAGGGDVVSDAKGNYVITGLRPGDSPEGSSPARPVLTR